MNQILEILEKNSHITPEQIAVMLGRDVSEVKSEIAALEEEGIIVGYKTLVDWDKTESNRVTAFIELRVTPQRGEGFDKIAERIYQYDQVKTVWLMSGSFDIGLICEGKTMKEVALFVAEKLAPMPAVVSTGTHFVLKTYKDSGVIYDKPAVDERSVIS
ncbi:MAG: Lrp/AsnC family transcriptional regulator [Clostridia bacterium]|nr:Lrp/AsnC family transcriptional regulator [Oscillospiraceae bacterium]MBQ7032434.1 Lrp/AsnC family transcriptional regulator [Clostridia bacterium]